MLLLGTQKIYQASNIQVVTVFKEGMNVGCYCKRVASHVAPILCHLHKPKPRRKIVEKKSYDDEVDSSSLRRSKAKILDYALSNKFDWFLTLTFNPDIIDPLDHELTKKHLSRWLNTFRYHNPDSKYILVPELHHKGGIHFHGLFSNVTSHKSIAINPHTGRKIVKSGKQVYNLDLYKSGYSTIIEMDDSPKTAYYITKYIKKEFAQNSVLDKKRYWVSKGLKSSLKINLTHADEFNLNENMHNIVGIYESKYYTKYTLRLPKIQQPFMLEQQQLDVINQGVQNNGIRYFNTSNISRNA